MTAAACPLPLPTARTLCAGATITGRVSEDLRAWIVFQVGLADETEDDAVGHLRCALFHVVEADADWRVIAHAGRALADALASAEVDRADRYRYAVGSGGQVRG